MKAVGRTTCCRYNELAFRQLGVECEKSSLRYIHALRNIITLNRVFICVENEGNKEPDHLKEAVCRNGYIES